MLSRLAAGRRKYGLKKFLVREANSQINRVLFKSTRQSLVKAFRSLGMEGPITVCAHASLSQLGYIEGGADAVVDALMETVATDGCLAMPAFSMEGSMKKYVASGATFDVLKTPSRVGAIPETFRNRAGVLRSLHPTNSLTAIGKNAERLLQGHENSLTPYGNETPYGRMVNDENAYILMINTHVQSLLHHIQERVDFPNLFLDDMAELACIDHRGERHMVTTRVMRPKTPYYIAIPGPTRQSAPDWALLHDYSLIFPAKRDRIVADLGYRFDGYPILHRRREQLIKDGTLRAQRLGKGQIGLLNVARFVRTIQPELEELIDKYRDYYNTAYIEEQNLRFG